MKSRNCIVIWAMSIFLNLTGLSAEENVAIKDSVKYELPKFIVTANRYEKNIFETNIPVNVVGHENVWQKGITTVGDLISDQAGVSYTSVGPWSQKIVIRGLVGTHVLTLVDGLRVNSFRSYGSHAPLVDAAQIEKVEIIRGPASILYGSEAVAGVVNYITKKPDFSDSGLKISSSAGVQYNTVNNQHNEQLTLSGGMRNLTFLLGVNNRQADDVDTPDGKLKNTAFSGYTIDGKIGYRINLQHRFQIETQIDRFKDVGVPINPYASHANFKKYNRDLITFSYEFSSPQKKWSRTKLNAFYQQGERLFDAFLYQIPKGALFVNQVLTAHRNVDSYGVTLQNNFNLFKNNLLIVGLDGFAEFDDTERFADPEIYNAAGVLVKNPPADLTPPTPKSNRKGVAVFLEDEYAVADKWNVNLGARFDQIISQADATPKTLAETNLDKTDEDFSGNLGILFRLNNNIHFMANIGRAFKAPTLQERFFKGTAQVGYLYGNPELKSEVSLNLDGGVKWQTKRFSGELNFFSNQIDDFIVMKPISVNADTFLYDNVGKAELYGGEIQIEYDITNLLSIFVKSSYTQGKDVNLNDPLPKVPPLTTIIGFRYEQPQENYWIEINSRIVDTQDNVAENEPETPGYTLFNFSSGYNLQEIIGKGFPLYLTFNVHNILDRSYRDHLSSVTWWDAPGRNFSFGIRTNF